MELARVSGGDRGAPMPHGNLVYYGKQPVNPLGHLRDCVGILPIACSFELNVSSSAIKYV
jgi:hypothetical protein